MASPFGQDDWREITRKLSWKVSIRKRKRDHRKDKVVAGRRPACKVGAIKEQDEWAGGAFKRRGVWD